MINEHQGGVECRSPLHSPPRLRKQRRCLHELKSASPMFPLGRFARLASRASPAPWRSRASAHPSAGAYLSRVVVGARASPFAPVLRSFARRSSVAGGLSRYARGRKAASLRSPFARSPVAPLPASPPPSVRSVAPLASLRGRTLPLLPLGGRPPSRRAPRSRPRRGLACPSASPRRAPSARGAVRAPLPRLRPCGGFGRSLLPPSWGSMGGPRSRFAPPRAAPALFSAAVPLRSAPAAPLRLGLLALGCRSRAPSPASRAPRPSGVWGSAAVPFMGQFGVFRACGRGLPPAPRPAAGADPRARG